MEKLTEEVLSKHLYKIKGLQAEVERLCKGNFLCRLWNFKKAMRLHAKARKELEKLCNPQEYWIL